MLCTSVGSKFKSILYGNVIYYYILFCKYSVLNNAKGIYCTLSGFIVCINDNKMTKI